MRTLEFGKYQHARVWIGELPDVAYSPIKVLTHKVAASDGPQREIKAAAIEILIVTGPRSLYGLLGGRLTPAATGHLSVDVSISVANERLFADNLAGTRDEVRVGLPSEYSQSVLAGVDLAKSELSTIASGNISINCAAHGVMGSCNAVYKHLTAILVKLFNASNFEPSDDDLRKLFPPTFS